jgi:CDP-4-dehydro-6-deoxyglucose reductase
VLINGPYGEFLLEEESERPAVLIAVGDGIAPIKSLAEHAIAIDRAVTLHLLRIDDLPPGSHIGNLCRSWHDALDNFSYARLPSTLGPADTLKELLQRFPRLDGCDLYVAAPQAWLTGLREALDRAETSPSTLKLDVAEY